MKFKGDTDMNNKLIDILKKQDLDVGQTIDLMSLLEDITEDLHGYDCKLRKAENEQQKKQAKDELSFEYSYYSSRINTLVNLIHKRLIDTQKEISVVINDGTKKE